MAMLRTIAALTTIVLSWAASQHALAAAYPERPIRLIVPFPPGGPTDVSARVMAQHLSASFGQIFVENRPGAGGTIGMKVAAAAEPDGYTLFYGGTATLAIGPALFKSMNYDPLKLLVPIASATSAPYVLIVAPDLPLRSVQQLVAFAKANPDALNFGGPFGTPSHLLAEHFKSVTAAPVVFVPYKGAATAVTDVLGGHIHATFETTSVLLPLLKEGTVRPLAIASAHRYPDLPDVPTMAESGVADFVASGWFGLEAPVGTPPQIIDKLNVAVNAVLRSDAVKAELARLGLEPLGGTADEFRAFIADEERKWGAMVAASGVKIE